MLLFGFLVDGARWIISIWGTVDHYSTCLKMQITLTSLLIFMNFSYTSIIKNIKYLNVIKVIDNSIFILKKK